MARKMGTMLHNLKKRGCVCVCVCGDIQDVQVGRHVSQIPVLALGRTIAV